jgi:hypothetical protein
MKKKKYKAIDKKEFLELYESGKTFKEIADMLDNTEINVQRFYYENWFAWQRLEIDRIRYKNTHNKEG